MRLFAVVIVAVMLMGCAKEINHRTLPFREIVSSSDSVAVDLPSTRSPLRVLYLGCGHLVFSFDQKVVMFDPFISTSPFFSRKVQSSEVAFAAYRQLLSRYHFDQADSASIWLAHSHYDHMLDVPMILEKGVVSKTTPVYGNRNGQDILVNFVSREGLNPYHVLEPEVCYSSKEGVIIPEPIYVSHNIRVTPILSQHAAHYKLVGPLKVHLMKGNVNQRYFRDHFKHYNDTTIRSRWKEGETYSFIVDFLSEERSVEYRVFIQSSGSQYPYGSPPQFSDGKPIDAAFLCLASANYEQSYPTQMIKHMKPDYVVFIHWEDFFHSDETFAEPRLVRMTNFRKLNRKLHREGIPPRKDQFLMPKPGTLVHFH